MTLQTQISLIREVRFSFRRPLAPIMHGSHKVLSQAWWEYEAGEKMRRPLWAVIVWRLRNWIPRQLWD